MSDDQESSSSALLIGLIVGGGVVVVLVLLAVIGAGFWFLMPVRGPVGPPPAAVVAVEAPAPGPVAVAEPLPENKGPVPEKKLIGVWDLAGKKDETATWEFREDGSLLVTAERPGESKLETKGRWELQAAKVGAGLKLIRTTEKGPRAENDIRFSDNDSFVIEGPGGGATYRRRAAK